jgi:RNA polymerase sigma factor (sigma-70 family)
MREEEFDRLYGEHAQRLFGFLVYRTNDRALAEDLVADTFERAYRARKRYSPRRGSPSTWLYAIALNVLRDHHRRQGAERRALERVGPGLPDGTEAPGLEQVEARDALGRALATLSPEERETVALRFGADLALRDIGKLVGEPRTTVEARLYRALRKLRDQLGDELQPR